MSVPIDKRLVLLNSASYVVAKGLQISVLVWLHQHLLRRISPEEYSLYPVVGAFAVFVPLLGMVLTVGLGRYVVEACAKGEEHRVTQIVSSMFPILLAAGLAVLVAGWVFAWFMHRVLTIAPHQVWDGRIMMALMVFSVSIQLITQPFTVGLFVRQKFVPLNVLDICRELLRLSLLFALLFGVSTRVLWVVVATVSADSCWLVALIYISCRTLPTLRFRPSEIRWDVTREITSFGTAYIFAPLARLIARSAPPIILNKLGTALDVTCFHLGWLVYFQIEQLLSLATVPLQPVLTAMHAMGSKERLRSAYLRGGRYALWAVLFLALPLIVYRREVIELYVGQQFLTAATVMGLLLSTFLITSGNDMMLKIGYAIAQVRAMTLRVALIQCLILFLTLYLVDVLKIGALGPALAAFLIIAVCDPLLNWRLAWRVTDVTFAIWLKETFWPGILPGLAATAVWVALRLIVHPHSWLVLGLCAACGCLCYGLVLFAFCLKPDERRDLHRLIEKATDIVRSVVRPG